MTETEALVLLILWLAIFVTLFIGIALLIVSAVIVERPAGYLKVREVFLPLWCLLAGREQRDRLQEILRARETADGTLQDVAEYRARHRAENDQVAGTFRPERYPLCGGSAFLYGYYPEKQLLSRDRDGEADLSLSRFIDILGV